jgi:glutaminyl-tRNA synthetase
MAVLDPIKVVITNYPEDKVEWLEAENNQEDETAGFRTLPFSRELYIEKEDFLEIAPAKFFRLSLGNEVRLKNGYIIKGESVTKDANGEITEIQVSYDEESKSGSGSEASQRRVAGTLHWVSVAHAVPAEVRLYDRLFVDEAPDSHKEKNFLEFLNPNSLEVVTGFVEPNLADALIGTNYQFQRLGYFSVDKDSKSDKLVFNKTVGLKDAWEEKGKKEANLLMNSLKDLNKYAKEKDVTSAQLLLQPIIETIQSVSNFSLLVNTISKNAKNDNNALLFANLILKYSDKISLSDLETELANKLVIMSLKNQIASVRLVTIENLKNSSLEFSEFKELIAALKESEKNEEVLNAINSL